MNYKTIFILIFCNSFLFNQEIIGEGLYTNELIDYLNQNYKTNSVLSYGNARDILYSEVDNNNGNVYVATWHIGHNGRIYNTQAVHPVHIESRRIHHGEGGYAHLAGAHGVVDRRCGLADVLHDQPYEEGAHCWRCGAALARARPRPSARVGWRVVD